MKKKGKYYKIAVFVGANRNSQLNIAIECINFLFKNFLLRLIPHNFYPDFNLKIKYQNKIYISKPEFFNIKS